MLVVLMVNSWFVVIFVVETIKLSVTGSIVLFVFSRTKRLVRSLKALVNRLVYSHGLLENSVVKVTHEHSEKAHEEAHSLVLPQRRLHAAFSRNHVVVE